VSDAATTAAAAAAAAAEPVAAVTTDNDLGVRELITPAGEVLTHGVYSKSIYMQRVPVDRVIRTGFLLRWTRSAPDHRPECNICDPMYGE
jgi:hypothetical protein